MTCTIPATAEDLNDYDDYGDYYDEEDDDAPAFYDTPVFYQIKLIQILDESGEALDLTKYPDIVVDWQDLSSSSTLRSL